MKSPYYPPTFFFHLYYISLSFNIFIIIAQFFHQFIVPVLRRIVSFFGRHQTTLLKYPFLYYPFIYPFLKSYAFLSIFFTRLDYRLEGIFIRDPITIHHLFANVFFGDNFIIRA